MEYVDNYGEAVEEQDAYEQAEFERLLQGQREYAAELERRRKLAIKCFVAAMTLPHDYREPNYDYRHRQRDWLLRGLRLWQEATGEDVSETIRQVKREDSARLGFVRRYREAHGE